MFASKSVLVASKSAIKKSRGHPSRWPPASHPKPAFPQFAVSPLEPAASGFVAPTGQVPTGLPFSVSRTPTLGIPVYSDYRNGRSRVVTIVRKISGDAGALRTELGKVLGGSARVDVQVGRVELDGNRVKEIKAWLAGLGF